MTFDRIRGQEVATKTLRQAFACGRVHHAYRFEGPAGVGKELTAFAFAQALLCPERERRDGCGDCSTCRRIVTFSDGNPAVPLHPDVLLVQRGLYPPAVLGTTSTEALGIGIAQIRRVILARAGMPPHEGRAMVCIIRDADELTVAAANALLKTLEEPQNHLHFVLLTSRPARLLDTLRSRTLPVRFGPLPNATLRELLVERGANPDLAELAEGSAATALDLMDPEASETQDKLRVSLGEALSAPDLATALSYVETKGVERHALRADLGAVALHLARRARSLVTKDPEAAKRDALRFSQLLRTREELETSAQVPLCLEKLIVELRRL